MQVHLAFLRQGIHNSTKPLTKSTSFHLSQPMSLPMCLGGTARPQNCHGVMKHRMQALSALSGLTGANNV